MDYTTNALNQYICRGNSADLFVLGLASASSAVKVNGVDTMTRTSSSHWGPTPEDYGLPFRQGDYFSARLQADNAAGPDWVSVAVEAGAVTQSGHLYHAPATETLTYDLDGNLTADGRWTYAWDGENRLISTTTTAAAVLAGVPDHRLTFAYDAQSRRIRKVVEHAAGVGSWQLDSDTRFIYDGWNLLAEVEIHNSSIAGRAKDAPAGVEGPYVRRSYLWGPDVSGTMQGAGGVGGLLAVRRHARGTKGPLSMWTAWDLNGNIIGLHQNTSRSALTANYDYDPFGKPLRVSEPEEDLNPFRFSTKYTDAETGLSYYGYRYYDAVRGRWISRDPIEEEGGINLYGFLRNDGVGSVDLLGLDQVKILLHEILSELQNDKIADIEGVKFLSMVKTLDSLSGYKIIVGAEASKFLATRGSKNGAAAWYGKEDTFILPGRMDTSDILHESIHAYNDLSYSGWLFDKAESDRADEGMAHAAENLYRSVQYLAKLERDLPRITERDRFEAEQTLVKRWNNFWGGVANISRQSGQVRGSSFDLNEHDYQMLRDKLGTGLSCKAIARYLNSLPSTSNWCLRFSCGKEEDFFDISDPYSDPRVRINIGREVNIPEIFR